MNFCDITKFLTVFIFYVGLFFSHAISANTTDFLVPSAWESLRPILVSRVEQRKPKMKLSKKQADSFVGFLDKLHVPTPHLLDLQKTLPKTTLELLMAVQVRGLSLEEAEKMAAYLQSLVDKFQFQNIKPFDENTSHIIGREWHEIDYTGENMTWQKQQQKYLPYGISNFKSLENLRKFFPMESKLPYFRKIYRPKNPNAL